MKLVFFVLLLVPLGVAQEFNVDLGVMAPGVPGTGTPDALWGGAAHLPGTWNDVPATGLGAFPLVDLRGESTGVSLQRSITGAIIASDNPLTTGSFQALMDDAQHTGGATSVTYWFNGLEGGRYILTTYAWSPLMAGDPTTVTVPDAVNSNVQTVGGILPGVDMFAVGITHAVHVLYLHDGQPLMVTCEGLIGGATVNGFQLSKEYRFTLSQSSTGGALTVLDSGGVPGNWYVNLATAYAGNFPNGWVFGIDISMADALIEVTAGPPFFGQLDVDGAMSYVVPSPFNAGLILYCVGLELDPAGPVVSVAGPFKYMLK